MQVEAGMCRKSRDGQNTAKTEAKCDTRRKTPKKRMRNGELSMFLDSAARRLWHFFARKHRKYRRENKTQVQFRASKCQNSSFSTCQQRNRHTPRGGRRTCCQQQQQLLPLLPLPKSLPLRTTTSASATTTTTTATTTTDTTTTTTTTATATQNNTYQFQYPY